MKNKRQNKQPQEAKALTVIPRKPDLKSIAELLNNDVQLADFFMRWLKNGRNATKAYMELHPTVDYHSARVLGSVTLAKINIPMILEALGMGVSRYFEQLDAGLNANRKRAEITDRDDKGRPIYEYFEEEDHKTRRMYHEALGKMLKLEVDTSKVQVNQFNFSMLGSEINKSRQERGLPSR